MKAILEFDLNDPDDIMAHMRCVKSLDMAVALWEITNEIRKSVEREIDADEKMVTSHYDLHEKIFDKISEVLEERGLKIDELIN